MSILQTWLQTQVTERTTRPLFATTNLQVAVRSYGQQRVLERHPTFDELMITTVETGLSLPNWRGIVYVMHWWRDSAIIPLYIGKTERQGRTHAISANIDHIRTNLRFFGRWGYGRAYHIGDLSDAVLGGAASPPGKYRRWAERLFSSLQPPTLREPVYVALISWVDGMCGPSGLPGSAPAVEKELIALASVEYQAVLLNVDGI
jgi:hypothetical protein